MFALFLKGLIIGLALAAPAGAVGILCMQRTLQSGFANGFILGLGAAVGDACYGAIAGFSLAGLSDFLIDYDLFVRILGGLFLIGLGVHLAGAARYTPRVALSFERTTPDVFTTGFLIKISHPVTILLFLGTFVGLGLGTVHPDHDHAATLVLSILVGSCLWWLLICALATWMRDKIDLATSRWVNRACGVILILFGIAAPFL